jgi:hypothetical protein
MNTGMIGVSLAPVSKPSERSPSATRRVFSQSRSRRSGSCSMMSSAARTPATEAGGALAVKISARLWCRR